MKNTLTIITGALLFLYVYTEYQAFKLKYVQDQKNYRLEVKKNQYIIELENVYTVEEINNSYEKYLIIVSRLLKNIQVPTLENKLSIYFLKIQADTRKKELYFEKCHILNDTIKSYADTFNDFDKDTYGLDVDDLQSIFSTVYLQRSEIEALKCASRLQNESSRNYSFVVEKIKKEIIDIFFESKVLNDFSSSFDGQYIEYDLAGINSIVDDYSVEISSLHPIASDKDVAYEYLLVPFKESVVEHHLLLSKTINNKALKSIEELYTDFLEFCTVWNLECSMKGESLPISSYRLVNLNLNLENNFKEEGFAGSLADEILNWIPFAGDAKELFDVKLFSTDKNKIIATKYLQGKVKTLNVLLYSIIDNYVHNMKQDIKEDFVTYLDVGVE